MIYKICSVAATCSSPAEGNCGNHHHRVHDGIKYGSFCSGKHHKCNGEDGEKTSVCRPATAEEIAAARLRGEI